MLLFILIFSAVIITTGLSVLFGFSFLNNRTTKSLQTGNKVNIEPSYKSLFAPSDAEIRAFERDAEAKVRTEQLESEQEELRLKANLNAQKLAEMQKIWAENPTKKDAVELLFIAAQNENAAAFSETAKSVIQVWQKGNLKNLTAADLAQLIESHLWLLPQMERTSGTVFWLKQEIANLRLKSEEKHRESGESGES